MNELVCLHLPNYISCWKMLLYSL